MKVRCCTYHTCYRGGGTNEEVSKTCNAAPEDIYIRSCIFADFDPRRKSLDMGTLNWTILGLTCC